MPLPGGAPLSISNTFDSVHDGLCPILQLALCVQTIIEVNATVGVIFAEHKADSTEVVEVVTNGLVVRPCVRLIRLCLEVFTIALNCLVWDLWWASRRVSPLSSTPTAEVLSVLQGTAGERVIYAEIGIFAVAARWKDCRSGCPCKRFLGVDQ